MATEYKIHLKNLQSADKTFWCFLDFPQSQISSEVFANSSTNLVVSTHQSGQDDAFTIPLQYVIQAGSSNNAVGLGTKIDSSIIKDIDLATAWQVDYFLQNKGPKLYPASDVTLPPTNEVDILTNDFDQDQEPLKKWFHSLTFGVQSDKGFMGVTWAPDPSETYAIKPKVQFYISTGSFVSNTLANMTSVSTKAAPITEDSFDGNNECTVTLLTNGKWLIEKGNTNLKLSSNSEIINNLVLSHLALSTAHAALVALYSEQASLETLSGLSKDVEVKSTGIAVKNNLTLNDDDLGTTFFLTGSITVGALVAAGFLYMIASGITLRISRRAATGVEFDFTYNGLHGADEVRKAFAAGKEIKFSTEPQDL
jgi:hypothetical protein